MSLPKLALLILSFLPLCYCQAQTDSVITSLQQFPAKYLKQIDNKIDKYSTRLTSKTEKTLTKLSRWEDKIHALLLKASPQTATRLFAPGQPTFNTLLQKLKQGEAIEQNYKAQYNDYRDKLTTGLKYIQVQEEIVDRVSRVSRVNKVEKVNKELSSLDTTVANSEAVEKFIKERKKQLINESIKYIGKSKYLSKINKEAYYYAETLRNYKQLFADPKKAEQVGLDILNKIPGFQRFFQQNSQLAALFRRPGNYSKPANLDGLQTRAAVGALIQQQVAAGGPNAMAQMQQNFAAAHSAIDKLKDKIGAGSGANEMEMPDFKPNDQKSKLFFQRLEYGFNVQFGKNNSLLPSTSDIALSLGYKLNNKSLAGIGLSYKLGLGNIQHIQLSSQGVGLRSFLDYKIKKQFFVTGGYEMNNYTAYKKNSQVSPAGGNLEGSSWQTSGLIGLSKKYKVSKKLNGSLQLLYDFLAHEHKPASQPVLFRVGYNF